MEWLSDNSISISPPSKPKKCTGTRFAAIMGLNTWNTPFKTWCEITRTYEEPFEETKYTAAGKVIEPKQAEYMKSAYFMTNLKTPTDIFGENYFKTTRGDFFPEHPFLGGMWDFLLCDDSGNPVAVLEMKTTKRSEDWEHETPPFYALQAALYAYLLGVDQVYMVASFLEEEDYKHPELFVPSVDNTIVRPFKMSERYPNFRDRYITKAHAWWHYHVEGGISPVYDEKADAKILKVLRTTNLTPDTDIEALILEAEGIQSKLAKVSEQIAPLSERLTTLKDMIKQYMTQGMADGCKKSCIEGDRFIWTVSRSDGTEIDKEKLAADGLLDKYSKPKTTYKLSTASQEG